MPRTAPDAAQERLTRSVVPLVQEKIEVLADFVPIAGWFFRPLEFPAAMRDKLSTTPGSVQTLAASASGLRELPVWDVPSIEQFVRDLPSLLETKPKSVFAALRLGMSGQSVTPGLFESLFVLGRDEVVSRLDYAVELAQL